MKKILILLILIISCNKSLNNLINKNKVIDEELLDAIKQNDIIKVEQLLNSGKINVNGENKAYADIESIYIIYCGKTALMYASENGHTKIVKLLIEKGANVNITDYIEWTALMYAAANGHIEIVKLLLDNDAYINKEDNKGRTALMEASTYGHTEIVNLLIEAGAANKDKALMCAKENSKMEIVGILESHGANLRNKKNKLLIEASKFGYKSVVELLINIGADVNNKDEKHLDGTTALLEASTHGHTEIVRLLIDKGAYVNDIVGTEGKHPLIEACRYGHIEIVKLLLDNGAYFSNFITGHVTLFVPLISVSGNGHKEIVKLLIEKGADINDKDNSGYTAIMYASENGHTEIVKLLIEGSADVNDKDNYYGRTALMSALASYNEHIEIVKLLIDNGANINDKDKDGNTALMYASEKGHIEIIKILIEKGANVSERNNEGKMALIYLSEKILNSHKKEKRDKYMDIAFMLIKAMEYEYIKVFIPLNKSPNINQDHKDYLKRYIGILHYFHKKGLHFPKDLIIKILGELCNKNDKEIFSCPEKKRKLLYNITL